MNPLIPLLERLTRLSQAHLKSADGDLAWPETLPDNKWFMPPELLSLYGTPVFDALDEATQRTLSFYETINFFSINVHGERHLIRGLTQQMYARCSPEVSDYLHHFIEEESRHMRWFARYCHQYGNGLYPERRLTSQARPTRGIDDLKLFGRILLFEELVDFFNRRIARDERIECATRKIHRLHHFEEARHLAFGRQFLRSIAKTHLPKLSPDEIAELQADFEAYLEATWKELFSVDAYRDTGLNNPYAVRREAWSHPSVISRRADISQRCTRPLVRAGIMKEIDHAH